MGPAASLGSAIEQVEGIISVQSASVKHRWRGSKRPSLASNRQANARRNLTQA